MSLALDWRWHWGRQDEWGEQREGNVEGRTLTNRIRFNIHVEVNRARHVPRNLRLHLCVRVRSITLRTQLEHDKSDRTGAK